MGKVGWTLRVGVSTAALMLAVEQAQAQAPVTTPPGDRRVPQVAPNTTPPPGDVPAQTQQLPNYNPSAGAAAEEDTTNNDIVVTGVKRALATSQNLKKNSDTFVDSITATDIGAFPDKSASEALQRVPGITVSRLQAADDSSHPSGEPTAVLIRGLTQVRTEFNGRDSFSADSARGLQFNDVSPELLAGVDAYKNQTAEMIEGGIAGTVNLRTRLPFDQKGLLVTGVAKANYGDKSEKWRGEFSGLVSDTFDTPIGRFGILGSYAQSDLITRTESVVMDKIDTYCTAGFGTAAKATVTNGAVPCTANPFGGTGFAYIPDGVRYSQVDYDRKRRGIAAAAQYENNSGNLRATVQFLQSKYRNAWLERASHPILEGGYFGTPAFNPRTTSILQAAQGTPPLMFGADGMLESGTLVQPHGSFSGTYESTQAAINAGSAVAGVPFVNYCGAGSACTTQQDGLYFQNEARNFAHRERTNDLSGNIRWDPTPRLHLNADVQHIDASTYNNDILVATSSMANVQYGAGKDGVPDIKLLPGSNVNYAAGGLANPHNYWFPFIQGHVEDNDGKETAARGDIQYDFAQGGWLDSLKVGVRWAERDQTVRYSTFNWTPISANWNCNGPGFNADNTSGGAYPTNSGNCAGNAGHAPFLGYGSGILESTSLGNFFNGSAYQNGPLVFLNRATLNDFPKLLQSLSGATTNSPIPPGYVSICDRAEATDGCFTPGEVLRVRERTKAAYAMLRFGGEDKEIFGGINVVGNVGVRVVQTQERSEGSVAFAQSNIFNNLQPCGTPLSGTSIVNPACYLTAAIRNFANGAVAPNTFRGKYTNWLPSFNVRFGLDPKDFVRFAYSKAIYRPDFGYLRNTVAINAPIINTTADSPYIVYNSPNAAKTAANVTGYNFIFTANAGNAALRPIEAQQIDLSFERYMGPASSFTFTGFYKHLSNYISFGQFTRTLDNGASSAEVRIQGPQNASGGGGNLVGFEAAYQTFFTFLPGVLKGLGAQLNYTFVHQSGITNTNLFNASSSGDVGSNGAGNQALGGLGAVIDSHRLAGISDHTFNIVGLYERGPVGLRLAYNWRSRFLTQNLDCCIGLPVFQKSSGFLDGSIRVSVNRFIELSVEASNLLNTTSRFQQQVFGDSPQTPGAKPVYLDSAWNRVDRRYYFGARVKF